MKLQKRQLKNSMVLKLADVLLLLMKLKRRSRANVAVDLVAETEGADSAAATTVAAVAMAEAVAAVAAVAAVSAIAAVAVATAAATAVAVVAEAVVADAGRHIDSKII
jgi:hypothetical protein